MTVPEKPGAISKANTTNPKDLFGAKKVSLSAIPPIAAAHEAHAMMDGELKTCRGCDQEKPVDQFYPNANGSYKRQYVCKVCMAVYSKIYQQQLKREVMDRYEGRCYCCGESTLEFLALDHIYGNGRVDGRGGYTWYLKLRREGYPNKDRYRVACHNCNMGRESNGGVCLHGGSR